MVADRILSEVQIILPKDNRDEQEINYKGVECRVIPSHPLKNQTGPG